MEDKEPLLKDNKNNSYLNPNMNRRQTKHLEEGVLTTWNKTELSEPHPEPTIPTTKHSSCSIILWENIALAIKT